MSFLTYARAHWEYLLSVALLLVASGGACMAAIERSYGLAGMAVFCACGFYAAAMGFAEADAWRRVQEDAARREQRAEDLKGDVV